MSLFVFQTKGILLILLTKNDKLKLNFLWIPVKKEREKGGKGFEIYILYKYNIISLNKQMSTVSLEASNM